MPDLVAVRPREERRGRPPRRRDVGLAPVGGGERRAEADVEAEAETDRRLPQGTGALPAAVEGADRVHTARYRHRTPEAAGQRGKKHHNMSSGPHPNSANPFLIYGSAFFCSEWMTDDYILR